MLTLRPILAFVICCLGLVAGAQQHHNFFVDDFVATSRHYYTETDTIYWLADVARTTRNVEVLSVRNIGSKDLTQPLEALPQMAGLKQLSVKKPLGAQAGYFDDVIYSQNLAVLTRNIHKFPNLEYISIYEPTPQLLRELQGLKKLKGLWVMFDYNRESPIPEELAHLDHVRTLSIVWPGVKKERCYYSASIGTMKSLEHLAMRIDGSECWQPFRKGQAHKLKELVVMSGSELSVSPKVELPQLTYLKSFATLPLEVLEIVTLESIWYLPRNDNASDWPKTCRNLREVVYLSSDRSVDNQLAHDILMSAPNLTKIWIHGMSPFALGEVFQPDQKLTHLVVYDQKDISKSSALLTEHRALRFVAFVNLELSSDLTLIDDVNWLYDHPGAIDVVCSNVGFANSIDWERAGPKITELTIGVRGLETLREYLPHFSNLRSLAIVPGFTTDGPVFISRAVHEDLRTRYPKLSISSGENRSLNELISDYFIR